MSKKDSRKKQIEEPRWKLSKVEELDFFTGLVGTGGFSKYSCILEWTEGISSGRPEQTNSLFLKRISVPHSGPMEAAIFIEWLCAVFCGILGKEKAIV